MSNIYFLLKPDAVRRGIWRQILDELSDEQPVDVKLFLPTPKEVLEIYPDFCWDKDFIEDWLFFYSHEISLIGAIRNVKPDYEALRARKGETFNADPNSIRGQYGASRLSNLIHLPSHDTESNRLQAIFERGGPKVELEAIDVILSTFHSPCPDDRMALLTRLEVRSQLLGKKMTTLFTQFRAAIPGSQPSNTLMRNFLVASKVMSIPISTSEELRLREVFGYPKSDKLPNGVRP